MPEHYAIGQRHGNWPNLGDNAGQQGGFALRFWRRLILLMVCLNASANGQYRVFPGNADADGLPTSPAKICPGASGEAHCYSPPGYMKDAHFGLTPNAVNIGKYDGQDLILFTAKFSGGGSGDLTTLALLIPKDDGFYNLLPKVHLTNQSEYKIWNLPKVSALPILVTADFIWDFDALKASNGQKETHFAYHRYEINAYEFDLTTGRYEDRLGYKTQKKYPGLDDVDEIHVIGAEKPEILARLNRRLSR